MNIASEDRVKLRELMASQMYDARVLLGHVVGALEGSGPLMRLMVCAFLMRQVALEHKSNHMQALGLLALIMQLQDEDPRMVPSAEKL